MICADARAWLIQPLVALPATRPLLALARHIATMQSPTDTSEGGASGSLPPPPPAANGGERRKIVIRVRRAAASPSPPPHDDHSAAAASTSVRPVAATATATAATAAETAPTAVSCTSNEQQAQPAITERERDTAADEQPVTSGSAARAPSASPATPPAAAPVLDSPPSQQLPSESQWKEAAALLVATVAQHAAQNAPPPDPAATARVAAEPTKRASLRPTSAAPIRTAPTAVASATAPAWTRPTSARRSASASLRNASPSPARAPSASPEPPNATRAASSSVRSGRPNQSRPPAWEGARGKSRKELDADSAFLSVEAVQAQWNDARAAAAAAVAGTNAAATASLEAARWGQALRALRSVCLIRLPSGKCGTGFLFADGFVMTNAHVIETAEEARLAKVIFFFDAERGDANPTSTAPPVAVLSLAPKELFIASPRVLFTLPDAEHLDYAVIKLAPGPPRTASAAAAAADPDDRYSGLDLTSSDSLATLPTVQRSHWQQVQDVDPLELSSADPAARDLVYVVQHPLGRAKQFHLDEVTKGNGKLFTRYRADTSYGSSGSPVISWTTGAVVALHHKSVCEDSQLPRGENQGILMSAIIADLNARSAGLLKLWTWHRTCGDECQLEIRTRACSFARAWRCVRVCSAQSRARAR